MQRRSPFFSTTLPNPKGIPTFQKTIQTSHKSSLTRWRGKAIGVHLPDLSQSRDYSCGAVALQAIANYFGVGPETEEEYVQLLKSDPENGTPPQNIIRVARQLGLEVTAKTHMTIEEVKQNLRANRPVLLVIQAWYPDYDRADFVKNDDGHYVIAVDYTEDGSIIFEDPSLKESRGYIPEQELLERWHDVDGKGKIYKQLGIAFYRKEPIEKIKSLDQEHEYGCLLLPLPENLQKQLFDWSLEEVPEYRLGKGGRCYEFHVTVKYGFKDANSIQTKDLAYNDVSKPTIDLIKGILRSYRPIDITLKKIGVFESGKDGTPLVIEVESPSLKNLHEELNGVAAIEDKWEYKPHITIAYLDPEFAHLYPSISSDKQKDLTWETKAGKWEGKPCAQGVSATRTGCIPQSGLAGQRKPKAPTIPAKQSPFTMEAMDKWGNREGTQAGRINDALWQGETTPEAIAAKTKIDLARVKGHLGWLVKQGRIEKVGKGYRILGEAPKEPPKTVAPGVQPDTEKPAVPPWKKEPEPEKKPEEKKPEPAKPEPDNKGKRPGLYIPGEVWIDEPSYFASYPKPLPANTEEAQKILDAGRGTRQEVDIRSLIPTQEYTGADKVWSMVNSDKEEFGDIAVIEVDGKRYLYDGHHRAAATYARGKDKVKARVVSIKTREGQPCRPGETPENTGCIPAKDEPKVDVPAEKPTSIEAVSKNVTNKVNEILRKRQFAEDEPTWDKRERVHLREQEAIELGSYAMDQLDEMLNIRQQIADYDKKISEVRTMGTEYWGLVTERDRLVRDSSKQRREAVLALLRTTRGLGGTVPIQGNAESKSYINNAIKHFPSDFVKLVKDRESKRGLAVSVKTGKRKGEYTQDIYRGGPNRIMVSGGSELTKNSVSVHEFGHAVHYASQAVQTAVGDWFRRRTRGQKKGKLKGYGRASGYEDQFSDPYVGRVYSHSMDLGGNEAFTTGLQKLYYGEYGGWERDREHAALILGILAGSK